MTSKLTDIALELDISIEDMRWNEAVLNIEGLSEKAITAAICAADKQGDAFYVSACFADDELIQSLNNDYRGKDTPTNVLSFPQIDWNDQAAITMAMNTGGSLGDIAIAFETIKREAEEQNKTISDHLTHMIVHSTLHLLGYDHIVDEKAQEMETLEIDILKGLDIKNPYED